MNSARRSVAVSFLVTIVGLFGTSPLLAETIYAVTWLGDLPGGANLSRAFGINNQGEIAGENETAQGTRAFLWLPAPAYGLPAGLNNLGALPGSPSSNSGDINDLGQVVGRGFPPNSPNVESQRAFRWENGVMTDIGNAEAIGINNEGIAVGYTQNPAHAALWDPAGNRQDIGGVLPLPDHTRAFAFKINAAGVVVGESLFPASARGYYIIPEDTNADNVPDRWFRDNDNDGINDLIRAVPLLPGATANAAFALNDLNQVIGLSTDGRGFLYDIGTGILTVLGDVPGGDGQNSGRAINNLGQIVGSAQVGGSFRAFIWDDLHGMRDLNSLTNLSPGLVLTQANDINESGQITGFGVGPGGFTDSFLLTPVPEPGTVVLGLIGATALAVGALRRRWNRTA